MSASSALPAFAELAQFPCLADNYGFLLHAPESGETAAIDTPDAKACLAQMEARGWKLTAIFNTHHHFDHAGGNLALKAATGCKIYGPAGEQERIPGLDVALGEGDEVRLGGLCGKVLEVPGHTAGHIAYYFSAIKTLFAGDTLFALGCGRLFEGSPAQMHHSLSKFAALPDATKIYCAHEYSEANLRFALSLTPDHPPLQREAQRITGLRANNLPTVPTLLGAEKEANPFLRAEDPAFAAALGMEGEDPVAIFAKARELKDRFRG